MTTLTNEQRQAVTTIDGNVQILSVAGSGKTHSFVTRIAYMIKNGIAPENIMAVTYTKKATEEMQKRLINLLGNDIVKRLTIGTFHAIAYKMLLNYGLVRGKLIQSWERQSILTDICSAYDGQKNPNGLDLPIFAVELGSFISSQKASLVRHNDKDIKDKMVLKNLSENGELVTKSEWAKAYALYEGIKRTRKLLDFDDLLLIMYDSLLNNASFRNAMQARFEYIMVDEGQDTSLVNMSIIKMINNENVCIVGDFRQSIYSFLNADVDNILNFSNNFKDVKLIEMTKNFRSTQNIVDFSNRIIRNSPIESYKRYKEAESANEKGQPVQLHIYNNESSQYDSVINKIVENHTKNKVPLSEMAILIRTNAESVLAETLLNDLNIPYEVSKQGSFFERKEIIDLMSYVRIVVDNDDDTSFRRIINAPSRFVRKVTIEAINSKAHEKGINMMQAVKYTAMRESERRNLSQLLSMIYSYEDEPINSAKFLREIIYKTKYMQYLEKQALTVTQLADKKKNIESLIKFASRFNNLESFVKYVAVMSAKNEKNKGKDTVKISTIHSSKGLEWDYVYVMSVDEMNMPHQMSNDIEEERRIFYVACSRPRKELHLCYSMFYDGEMLKPSPYIVEMFDSYKALKEMEKPILRGEQNEVIINM